MFLLCLFQIWMSLVGQTTWVPLPLWLNYLELFWFPISFSWNNLSFNFYNNLSSSALPCDSSFLRYSRPISDLREKKFNVRDFYVYLDRWLDTNKVKQNIMMIIIRIMKIAFTSIFGWTPKSAAPPSRILLWERENGTFVWSLRSARTS